jgi:hypothetical protein
LGLISLIVLAVHLPLNVFLVFFSGETGDGLSLSSFRLERTLETLIGILSTLALAGLVESVRQGGTPSLRRCFGGAVSRWGPAIGTQMLLNLSLLLGFLLLVLPSIFIAVATAFSLVLVALRESSGTAALQGSWDLVRGRWWPTFRLLALLVLCEVGIAIGLTLPATFLPDHPLILVADGLITDFVMAYFFVALVVLFLELEAQAKVSSEAPDPPLDEPGFRIGFG